MQADVTVITEKQFESLKGTSRLQPTTLLRRWYWTGIALNQLFHSIPKPEPKEYNGCRVQSQGNTALLSRQAAEDMRLPIL